MEHPPAANDLCLMEAPVWLKAVRVRSVAEERERHGRRDREPRKAEADRPLPTQQPDIDVHRPLARGTVVVLYVNPRDKSLASTPAWG